MNICQFCGWEVKKPEWYNSYDGGYSYFYKDEGCPTCQYEEENK